VIADADARHLYSVVEALLASNRAMQDSLQAIQDRHQSSLQSLQESLISSQHSLQEALVQTQNFTLAFAAGCLGAALLAVVVVRGRVGPS
jgi:predicted PurR-regulated permease PerM